MDGTIREANFREALSLPPAPFAIALAKPGDLTNGRPNRKRFNLRNRGTQFEMHRTMVAKSCGIRQWERLQGSGVSVNGAGGRDLTSIPSRISQ